MSNDELIWHVREHTVPAALSLLPGRMNSAPARAMLFATGLQESNFSARRQKVAPGVPPPASGFWQFERGGGVTEILASPNTRDMVLPVCKLLLIEPTPSAVHEAIVYNDVLACVFARLLLYRDPRPMPLRTQAAIGWSIYAKNWRPGRPHPENWPRNFEEGWRVVEGDVSPSLLLEGEGLGDCVVPLHNQDAARRRGKGSRS